MNIAALHSVAPAIEMPSGPTTAQVSSSPASSSPEDKVTLSSAAQRGVSASGDVDHDGDSH